MKNIAKTIIKLFVIMFIILFMIQNSVHAVAVKISDFGEDLAVAVIILSIFLVLPLIIISAIIILFIIFKYGYNSENTRNVTKILTYLWTSLIFINIIAYLLQDVDNLYLSLKIFLIFSIILYFVLKVKYKKAKNLEKTARKIKLLKLAIIIWLLSIVTFDILILRDLIVLWGYIWVLIIVGIYILNENKKIANITQFIFSIFVLVCLILSMFCGSYSSAANITTDIAIFKVSPKLQYITNFDNKILENSLSVW